MKRIILTVTLSLIISTLLFAQYNNKFSINVGEKYLTDWRARYGLEYGASFTHVFFSHYSVKATISDYYKDITPFITDITSPYGFPLEKRLYKKEYFELNLCFGYFFDPEGSKIKINSGVGISYRKRNESFIAGYGIHSGGWGEIFTTGYSRKEFGGVINLDVDYAVWKWISLGLYTQLKIYPKHTEVLYPELIEHESPNSVSYGLSAGFHF